MTTRILLGDCRALLKTLPDEFVHCCVTSPPYWGLRDYGTARWEGGNSDCDHVIGEIRTGLGMKKLSESYRGGGVKASEPKPMTANDVCPHCGATRIDQQIGLESTPEQYVANLVEVFREVKRVLRKDGTCWVVIGDSYNGAGPNRSSDKRLSGANTADGNRLWSGCKIKDLVGIPWRVAFALQADGWWLRQDIIWSKPNPMPESVTDRCTKSHEYVFLLTKSANYWYDAEAIKEPLTEWNPKWGKQGKSPKIGSRGGTFTTDTINGVSRIKSQQGSCNVKFRDRTRGRNRRSVWTIATQPYSGAHFATFPPALIEPMILAGCPEGGTVLDPFAGSGTTGQVAERLGRHAILIELNPDYLPLADRRTAQAGLALGAA